MSVVTNGVKGMGIAAGPTNIGLFEAGPAVIVAPHPAIISNSGLIATQTFYIVSAALGVTVGDKTPTTNGINPPFRAIIPNTPMGETVIATGSRVVNVGGKPLAILTCQLVMHLGNTPGTQNVPSQELVSVIN